MSGVPYAHHLCPTTSAFVNVDDSSHTMCAIQSCWPLWPLIFLVLTNAAKAWPLSSSLEVGLDTQEKSLVSTAGISSAATATTPFPAPAESSSSAFIAAISTYGNIVYPLTLGISTGAGLLVLLALLGLCVYIVRRRRTRAYKKKLSRGRQPMVVATSGWTQGFMVEAPTKPPRGYVRLGVEEASDSIMPESRQPIAHEQHQPDHVPSSRVGRGRASSFVEHFDVHTELDKASGKQSAKISEADAAYREWRSGKGLLMPAPPAVPSMNR